MSLPNRPIAWRKRHSERHAERKLRILSLKGSLLYDRLVQEKGRLRKTNLSDLTSRRRPRYDRAAMRAETNWLMASYECA